MNWFELVKFLAPLIVSLIPALRSHPTVQAAIVQGIGDAEALPGASGGEKKAHVMNLVGEAVAGVNDVRPGSIDVPAVTSTASAVIDTVVGVVKLVHANHGPVATAPSATSAAS